MIGEMAKLLGERCERINFASSTTLEQLIGSTIPRYVNGDVTFEWRDGALTRALKEVRGPPRPRAGRVFRDLTHRHFAVHRTPQGKWILFDEINLACPEVLDGLSPLLDPIADAFHIEATNEDVPIQQLRVFATMNPSSIGGNRRKLPRGISNVFTSVKLSEYAAVSLSGWIAADSALLPVCTSTATRRPRCSSLCTSSLGTCLRTHVRAPPTNLSSP